MKYTFERDELCFKMFKVCEPELLLLWAVLVPFHFVDDFEY